jgi:hypothetical protein
MMEAAALAAAAQAATDVLSFWLKIYEDFS